MEEEQLKQIEKNIIKLADENNWELSKNVSKIAKVKLKFFGFDEWERCPCYPKEDTIHGCGTEECAKDIETDGKCHCNLFLKKQ